MKLYAKCFQICALFLSMLLLPANVFGEAKAPGPETTITLEEVVVTATRDQEEIRQVPANVTVITAQQIKESGATNIVEVLDKLESIQFRDYSGNSSQSIIDMRGFGGDNPFGKTLVTVDGMRINRPDMNSVNWMQIPLGSIERIEVVRGANSVLYGDAAIGGSVNIITKKGQGEPKFDASVQMGSYGLNNERVGVSGSAGKWNYALTGENNFNFGYRERSKFSSDQGGLNLGYDASEWLSVSSRVSFNKIDYQMPGTLTAAQMAQNPRQYQPLTPSLFEQPANNDDASEKYTNASLGIKSLLGSLGEIDINFLYGNKNIQTNMTTWGVFSAARMDTYSITPKYILAKEIFGFNNKLIMGLDYYHEPYHKDFFSSRERTSETSTADLTRDSTGYYARDEFNLLKTLILSAGYRTEQTSIKGSNTDMVTPGNNFTGRENTYNCESYEVGLTWLIGQKSKVFAKYGTVYRIPFLDEVASFNGFGGGTLFNNNLKQEKGVSMEVGTQFYPLDNLKIGLTVFRIDMEDEISWYATGPFTGYNKNQDNTRHDGVEVSLSYLWEKWARLYGNFTYHKATYENGPYNQKELALVPNRMANAGVEIYLPYDLMLRPEVRYVGDAYLSQDYYNVDEKLPSYTLINLYLFYKPPKPFFGKVNMTAFIGVDNLADISYASFGSYNAPAYGQGAPDTFYPMPGITFKGGLSFSF